MTQDSSKSAGSLLSAILLVAGTCIGGGMLALPIITGLSGFIPSLVTMVLCWLAMMSTALLLIEVNLWMPEGAHISTMTSTILGKNGKIISWILYLFIAYASLVAYSAGLGAQISSALLYSTDIFITKEMSALICIALFTFIIYLGSLIVGRVNAILCGGMIASYFVLIGMGIDEIKPTLLEYKQWHLTFAAVPLLLTSFSFQTMVPSLTPILKRNANHLRTTVIVGTTITFLTYALWQLMILGIIPVEGEQGLKYALDLGTQPATTFLREHVQGNWIYLTAEFFAFFAIVTSYLGIALGLFDFLADGLNIPKKGTGKLLIGCLIAIPTFYFATHYERIFLAALDTSGGFGDAILNGLIPILMVWIGRYHLGYQGKKLLPGGKIVLILLTLFFLTAVFIEVLSVTGNLPFYSKEIEEVKIHDAPLVGSL